MSPNLLPSNISRFQQLLSLVLLLPRLCRADSFFFNNTNLTAAYPNLSQPCVLALNSDLSCDAEVKTMMLQDSWGPLDNATVQDILCRQSCSSDLEQYRADVSRDCATDQQILPGRPLTWWGDSASAAWNQTCLKDPETGEYCVDVIASVFANNTEDNDGTGIPTENLCSNCFLGLLRQIQSTSFSNYDETIASTWQSIQSKCNVNYPIDVQPLTTNVTTPGGFAPPGITYQGCLSGNTYNVASGDNCEKIAEANSVSLGSLRTLNSLYDDCRNLLAGATLCLPAPCTTYVVQSGDTCSTIANSTSNSFSQILAYNPVLDNYCSNLIAGESICISPPGGAPNLTTIAGTTATQTAVYGSTTAPRPSPVATGTTQNCAKYYLVQPGDYCQLVSLNQTVDLGLFLSMNPQIDSACDNLLSGFYYCVMPIQDWNSTASSTVVTAPTTTPSGTTSSCYQYYTIQSGDYCGKVEDMFSITFLQFQYWNPDIKADCSNLLLGEAYCVNGADQPPEATQAASSESVSNVDKRYVAFMPEETGGVPYGWPGVKARALSGGVGIAKVQL